MSKAKLGVEAKSAVGDEGRLPYKIFPRNLTARAEYVVAGNPTNSRPEAGVDNCYPGLEFDQRNLDQQFFPGLVFYFHRSDGARLIDIRLTDDEKKSGLTAADLSDPPLYLWGMLGRHLVQQRTPSMLSFQGQSGMEVWRRVHDLLPGTVAIVFGPTPGLSANLTSDLQAALSAAHDAGEVGNAPKQFTVVRDKGGKISYAVFAGPRAPYLDTEGVIDPIAYAPGDLTKTMCAPWMYDFRDCYCFYWSSNKPDIVNVPMGDDTVPYVNFLRQTKDRQGVPPPDIDYYWKIEDGKKKQRRDLELTYKDMVEGWSHRLPVVLNDTESRDSVASEKEPLSPAASELEPPDIVKELSYLATVEHALTVEYLYAYYSIAAGARGALDAAKNGEDPVQRRITAAATQVFQVAVDEMRHFMWANLCLHMLGAPASVGRAARIAEPPSSRNGRRTLKKAKVTYLDQPFALNPLDGKTLDWFITVEAKSKVVNEGLDGMYVYVLQALELWKDKIPNAERIIPMIKLIVDEGAGHWRRFSLIKETLEGIPERSYLRPLSTKKPTAEQEAYLQIADSYYHVLLKSIELSLTLGEKAQAQLVGAAVRVMSNLDDIAVVLANEGFLPQFNLPPKAKTTATVVRLPLAAPQSLRMKGRVAKVPINALETSYGHIDRALKTLSESNALDVRLRASRQRQKLAEHVADVNAILERDARAGGSS